MLATHHADAKLNFLKSLRHLKTSLFIFYYPDEDNLNQSEASMSQLAHHIMYALLDFFPVMAYATCDLL